MFKKFYTNFIKSTNKDPDIQAREFILNCILIGLIILCLINSVNSLFSLIFKHEFYVIWRLVFISCLLIFFATLYLISKRKSLHNEVSLFICSLFFGLATFVLVSWGLQDPIASSLFCLVIIMAGILIGARYSLYVLIVIIATFLVLLMLDTNHMLHPDTEWTKRHISLGDAISFITLFAIIALISWLFNRKMELALKRARKSEEALRHQRDKLEVVVQERTRELQAEQLQKVQQVYRFAELGHLSTALFHDLANFSSSLTLDTEGLKEYGEPDIVSRIQQNVKYINDVVRRVNLHLHNGSVNERTDIVKQIDEIVSILKYEANKCSVTIKTNVPQKRIFYKTDTTRFRQLITNLISNAIEAYEETKFISARTKREVVVDVKKWKENITISVTDYGKGITPSKLERIFEPFYSGKSNGTGIGLFIVKQITQKDLKGTIRVISNKKEGTIFTVNLPLVSNS